ncbi:MAG: hypothetical protein J6S67_18335 [Methanobrevibacter sp.]|nr:hypothetical protein [Methanobrevibacter sp.]
MLNGFDISNYQSGIQLNSVDFDFCIVQHSFGSYVQPTFYGQIGSVLALGKKAGIYHYVTGEAGEIETFINGFKPYAGRAIPALDFERSYNSKWFDFSYLFDFASEIINQTGVRPLLYGSASIYQSLLDVGNQLNCGLWIAQYATDDPTGYQSDPWNESSYNMALFQYSSTGRLSGYNGDLDLDLFYGDGDTWALYSKSDKSRPAPKRVISVNMDIDENDLKNNCETLPIGKKIAITNTKSGELYLTSHNGRLCMTTDPMAFMVQKNSDNSISLADPWGNWITVSDKPSNCELPTVVKGNGQITQRWMASPYNGGFKLTTAVDKQMNLDLPGDNDFNGANVQVYSAWPNNEMSPNQTWKYRLYSEIEEEKAKSEAKPAIKEVKPISKPITKEEIKPADSHVTKENPAKTEKPIEKEADKTTIKATDKPIVKPAENGKVRDTHSYINDKKDNKGDKEMIEDKESKIIGDVAQTIEGDLKNGSIDADAGNIADKMSGMIEEALGKKALNRKTVRWVFLIAIIIALACIVLSALSLAHCLPMWVAGLCSMIACGTGIGGHSLGISATTK